MARTIRAGYLTYPLVLTAFFLPAAALTGEDESVLPKPSFGQKGGTDSLA